MDLTAEITKLCDQYRSDVERQTTARLLQLFSGPVAKRVDSPVKRRGPRTCAQCGKRGHDARKHAGKGAAKKAA